MAVFVIVHGGWGGGWEWQRVAPLLRAAGHDVFTPTLTGTGERAHLLSPAVDLGTHVADILGVLRAEWLTDVILAGHSYAGMVITGVASRDASRLGRLVYIDAFVPLNGESAMDLIPADVANMFRGMADPAQNAIASPGMPDAPPGSYDARLTAHPWRTMSDPIALGGETTLPVTYVRCVSDDPLAALLDKSAARARERGWDYRELEAPHDVQWFVPEKLAEILLTLAD